MKTPTDTLALFAHADSNFGAFGTLRLTVIIRRQDTDGPFTRGWTEARYTAPSNSYWMDSKDYPTFDSFQIRAQWEKDPATGAIKEQPYGMRFGFENVDSTITEGGNGMEEITQKYQTLTQIQKRYAALIEKLGNPASLEEFVVLVARAMHIDLIAEFDRDNPNNNTGYVRLDSTMHLVSGPTEMKRYIRRQYEAPRN